VELDQRKPKHIVVNGRHYRGAQIIAGGLRLQRTFGQWVRDQLAAVWIWLRLVWSILFWSTLGCGGAPFELVDNLPQPETGVVDAGSASDVRVTLKPDVGFDQAETAIDARSIETSIEAQSVEASPIEANSPEADPPPDACAAPAWDCRGARVSPYNFCVIYLAPNGAVAGNFAEGNAGVGCPACGGGCACLSTKTICGYFGSGPLAHYAGCIERIPNQPEVTCQE
jgi:hypothetical protein